MPRGHGRISSSSQSRRNNYIPRRPLGESNNKSSLEERQISTVILGNTEQRCIIFTLVAPEIDDYFKLAAFIQSLNCANQRNNSQSAPLSEPTPAITFLFNLQKEDHKSVLSKNTCSPNSSQMDIISRSGNRNKRTKSLKDSSTNSSHSCLAIDTSSGSPCDSLSPISSDDLVNDIATVDKLPLKKSSKKKGKKKGKHYKGPPSKKEYNELSENCSFSPSLLVEDATREKEGRDSNNIAESSGTIVSCISYNDDELTNNSTNMSGEVDSGYRKYDPSINSSISINCDSRESYYSEGVFHAHCSTERAQSGIEACSNNDFQPVISGKRGRCSRKLTVHSGKDLNNHSVWQKVQKNNVSPKVDASKGSFANFNQSANMGKNHYSSEIVGEPSKSSDFNLKKKQANNHLKKGPHNCTANHSRPSKMHIQQKEGLNVLPIAVKSTEKHINEAKLSRNSCNPIDVKGQNSNYNFNDCENSNGDLHCMDNSDNQCIVAEKIDVKSNSGPELQKWVPGERKISENFTASLTFDESITNIMLDFKNSEAEAITMEMQCSSRSGDDADCSSSENDILSGSKFETDLEKILNASNDSCQLYNTICVHMTASSPLAEFERFMLLASPVIYQRNHINDNISLASIWQWYEEPGCYGLEVKAEDMYKYRRLCEGFLEFTAYFVPFLSAVQLFGKSCEVDKRSISSSNLSKLPILSSLLPKPENITNSNDEELIFEYFEHAQPPQRRPLFEKISKLVNGDSASNSHMYGDPSKLQCLNLHDIHPASWYAVAWYPIYRIPDGNFRAAFLTYHSLGHFVKKGASSNMTGEFTRMISPVVGLQSYNAKKECWFQPRSTKTMEFQKEEHTISASPSKLLEERLHTLEKTASIMATATVRKGNLRSINNHPDYNHFFSRW